MHSKWRWAAAALVLVAGVAACAFAFRQSLAQAGVRALASTMGLTVAFGRFEFHANRLSAADVRIANVRGEPVAAIGQLGVRYSLWDLLTGSRAYGLRGFDLERARFTVIRHPDGTFNVPIPKFGGKPSGPLPRFAFDGRLRDVSLDVEDRAQGVPSARHLAIRDVDGDFDVDTTGRSRYRVGLAYVENGRRFPVTGTGDVDVPGGFGLQRWRSAQLPIERIVDIALNSPSFHIVGGSLYDVDARIVGFAGPGGTFGQRISATATIDRARIAIGGLTKPLRDVRGKIAAYDDGLLLQDVGATIAGVPIRLGGGVYHLGDPAFRLTVSGSGNLRDLRGVLAQTAALPLAGPSRLDVTVEGAPSKPLTLIALHSPRMTYAAVPIDEPAGSIAFDGQEVDVVDARARYAGIGLNARGRLNLHPKRNALEMVASADAPPDALPYAAAIIPRMPVRATLLAIGDRPSTATIRGTVYGKTPSATLATAFDLRADGLGTIGPIRLDGRNQSLYAIAALDARHRGGNAYLLARNVHVDDRTVRTLPGFRLDTPPAFAATVDATMDAELRDGRLRSSGIATLSGIRTQAATVSHATVRFAATPQRPIRAVISAAGISPLGANAAATLSYDRGTLRVRDAAAASYGSFADARGSVTGLANRRPHYDFEATVHSADVARIASLLEPKNAVPIEGTLEARLRVSGAGSSPVVAGTVRLPEGAANGLAFHALAASVSGSTNALALRDGRIAVGSSALTFAGDVASRSQSLRLSAPEVDLEDFNDFFDPGDMLAGTGRVQASVALTNRRVVATSGQFELRDAAVRGYQIGAANASWHGRAPRIEAAVALAGASGRLSATGTVDLNGGVDISGRARDVALAQWLPVTGLTGIPVTGFANADATVAGRFPNLTARVDATVASATVGRVPIEKLEAVVAIQHGRGRVERASLVVPHARVDGSGAFGLRADDPLGLTFVAHSKDVAALAATLSGHTFDAAGALDTTLRVAGTRAHPVLDDDFVLTGIRYGRFTVARASGHVRVDQRSAALSAGEIDLAKGRLLAQADVPIRLMPFAVDERGRAVSGSLTADDVEASNLVDLLPKGTKVDGRLDGRVTLAGTIAFPRLDGQFDLAGGAFSGPQETVPITGLSGRVAFAGDTAFVQNLRAQAGGGTLTGDGQVAMTNLRDLGSVAASLNLSARALRLDLPQYVKGQFDGDLHLVRQPNSRAILGGSMALSNARIPLTALYNPKSSSATPAALPDLGFNLQVAANRDVRVVSPNVDVGVGGSALVAGTLEAPTLAGTFRSTGGTVSFLRDFRIQRARATFDPASGVVPMVDATATAYVADPSTDVTLRVTGPATALNVAFSSDPPYDREQILGLLVNAQAFGAVRGVATTGGSFSASSAVAGLAAGQLNQVFTRNLLEPLSLALGENLGLTNLQITSDVQAGLGVSAAKAFGKNLTFIFAQSFNETRRTSWTLQAHPSIGTQLQLTAYTTQSVSVFALSQPPAQYANGTNLSTVLLGTGTNGLDFKFKRTFP
ncbi:MAG TPA: translocation/assembly module TamB domain-containing protein [Candidatus Tumulicola sp.]|jgi:autotransporter translocation and assembly factor TamB